MNLGFLRRVAVLPIRLYQYCISPLLPARCRFYPSCSEYARQALLAHGVFRGGFMALARLLRCHPWSAGGYDPVPPAGVQGEKGRPGRCCPENAPAAGAVRAEE